MPRVEEIPQNNTNTSLKALPQKRYYRQRAHSNPMSDHNFEYPKCPSKMDWTSIYPKIKPEDLKFGTGTEKVRFLDIGCGYGGLLIKLAEYFPEKMALGLEIRVKVSAYVQERIKALQNNHISDPVQNPINFQRTACIRSNAMKLLPHFFEKGQMEKLFFLFPDPHFKKRKNKWRIISNELLAEYAYLLKVGGIVYTITDVKEVHDWMVEKLTNHPLFERIPEDELENDDAYKATFNSTEEGKKVARNEGSKWPACFRRVECEKSDIFILTMPKNAYGRLYHRIGLYFETIPLKYKITAGVASLIGAVPAVIWYGDYKGKEENLKWIHDPESKLMAKETNQLIPRQMEKIVAEGVCKEHYENFSKCIVEAKEEFGDSQVGLVQASNKCDWAVKNKHKCLHDYYFDAETFFQAKRLMLEKKYRREKTGLEYKQSQYIVDMVQRQRPVDLYAQIHSDKDREYFYDMIVQYNKQDYYNTFEEMKEGIKRAEKRDRDYIYPDVSKIHPYTEEKFEPYFFDTESSVAKSNVHFKANNERLRKIYQEKERKKQAFEEFLKNKSENTK